MKLSKAIEQELKKKHINADQNLVSSVTDYITDIGVNITTKNVKRTIKFLDEVIERMRERE